MYEFVRGKGIYLYDKKDKPYLDLISGIAVNNIGHNNKHVVKAVKKQIDKYSHQMVYGEYVVGPQIKLAKRLSKLLPDNLQSFYFLNSGSEAVEGAMKLAKKHTGRGKIVLRGKANIETNDKTGKETIIINEIPYQVNKANLVSKIAELVNTDKISGISDLRDESDRNGLRIVVEVKRDAMASVVLSKLYKYSYLQTSFGVNNIALVNGRPQQLNVKQMLTEFIKFRLEVIVRRTKYDLKKAEERAHILEGLLKALANIDQVIAIIRASKTVEAAKEGLTAAFELSEIQAKAILEMRLQKLVSLEVDKIKKEHAELMLKIANYKEIIASEDLQRGIIKDEMAELKEKYGDERRTDITYAEDEIKIEDLIANELSILHCAP